MRIDLSVETFSDEAYDVLLPYFAELKLAVAEFVDATNDPSARVVLEDSYGVRY